MFLSDYRPLINSSSSLLSFSSRSEEMDARWRKGSVFSHAHIYVFCLLYSLCDSTHFTIFNQSHFITSSCRKPGNQKHQLILTTVDITLTHSEQICLCFIKDTTASSCYMPCVCYALKTELTGITKY